VFIDGGAAVSGAAVVSLPPDFGWFDLTGYCRGGGLSSFYGLRAVFRGHLAWSVLDLACCLTIESEEREAWTADVLANGIFRDFVEERHSDGHVI
jgi:hypothetical protein